jgi:hypothetical protein
MQDETGGVFPVGLNLLRLHSPCYLLVNADFREPLTLLISAHLWALSVPTFGVIVELRCINAGTDKSIYGGSYAR